MATATVVCSSCDDSEVELYYCKSCSESAELESTEQSTNERELCEICLGAHVRKGHQVRNLKDQEPLVCAQHRCLHKHYCKTCDVTFCGNCLGNHSEHKLGSIDERAIEVKKEVFEMLTKLELVEKPLGEKKKAVGDIKKFHESDQKKLKELLDREIKELNEIGLNRIEENLKFFAKKDNEVGDVIENVSKLQRRSRELLILTSSHL